MEERDIVSWNRIIAAYRRHGFPHEAVSLFHQMQGTGIQPNQFTFASVLPAFAKLGDLKQGMDIHQSIKEKKILSDVVVVTALVDMYVKCGSIDIARDLFDKMRKRNVVSWNVMIAGYVQSGFVEKALKTFKEMQLAGVNPDSTIFASLLPACAKMDILEQGMDIHRSIIDRGVLSDVAVASALVDMYAKCGSINKAREVFDTMSERNVVSWNAMILGYAQNGFDEKALELFKQMQLTGVKPDSATFASVLPACAKLGDLKQGMDIHKSINGGIMSDVVVASALVDMYAKCRRIDRARELFDRIPQRDLVSWNAMIAGYAQNGFAQKALQIFKQMRLEGLEPNSTTFASILPACAKMRALEQGIVIHRNIVEGGFWLDIIVGNALVNMYAKCGRVDKAFELFDRMPERDVVSWNAMISGYAQNGFVEKALETFKKMKSAGLKPNSSTFASTLPTCAKMGALEQGMDIHKSIIKRGFLLDIKVGNSLVDMYAKCGNMDTARELFDRMPERDVISWNTVISGYTRNRLFEKGLEAFKQMQSSSVKPNSTTFAIIDCLCQRSFGTSYEQPSKHNE